jgi:iron complex transport system permease protein
LSAFAGRTHSADAELARTLLTLRLSRTAVAGLVGAALAVAGVLMQGLFRNPLASPSVLGASAAAGVGGQAALLASGALLASTGSSLRAELFVPVGCLLGALFGLLLVLSITRFSPDSLVLLLTGFLLSSLFVSAGALLTSLSQENWELGRAMVAFTLGDVGGSGWRQVLLALPLVVFGVAASWFWGRPLDLLLSGEDEARTLGVDVDRVRLWSITWSAVLTAASVSVAGNVSFVGLVVPHALRPFTGERHRILIPASALGGAAFVIACDVACRKFPGQADLPLGVITGLIGAPVFLALLLRSQRGGSNA